MAAYIPLIPCRFWVVIAFELSRFWLCRFFLRKLFWVWLVLPRAWQVAGLVKATMGQDGVAGYLLSFGPCFSTARRAAISWAMAVAVLGFSFMRCEPCGKSGSRSCAGAWWMGSTALPVSASTRSLSSQDQAFRGWRRILQPILFFWIWCSLDVWVTASWGGAGRASC